MSDTEDLEIPIEVEPPKPEKKKRVMSELQLEKLKLARDKAAQVKRAAKIEKDKVQQVLIEKEKAKRLAKMQDKIEKQHIDLDEKPEPPPEPLEAKLEVIKKPKKPKKKSLLCMTQALTAIVTHRLYIFHAKNQINLKKNLRSSRHLLNHISSVIIPN